MHATTLIGKLAGTTPWRRKPELATSKNKYTTKRLLGTLVKRYQPVGFGGCVEHAALPNGNAAPQRAKSNVFLQVNRFFKLSNSTRFATHCNLLLPGTHTNFDKSTLLSTSI